MPDILLALEHIQPCKVLQNVGCSLNFLISLLCLYLIQCSWGFVQKSNRLLQVEPWKVLKEKTMEDKTKSS